MHDNNDGLKFRRISDQNIEEIKERLDTLESSVTKVHDFFYGSEIEGRANRITQIDDLLFAAKAGKVSVRALLYLASAAAIMTAGAAAVRGWFW